jgi:uncharacterized iron-regulated protein
MTARFRASCLALLVACGGRYGGTPTVHTAKGAPAQGDSKRGIEAAALPYRVLDARTGHEVAEPAFWDRLASARAVCVGEDHPNPHHHWVQLHIVQTLAPKWPHFGLGMEMFQRPFQGVLDDFAAGKIDDAAMRSRTGWEDRWGYDYKLYGPIFAAAVAAHGKLLALNAAKELTKKVVHHGLESLTPEEKAQVPELVLTDATHRAWFDQEMEDMGGASAHTTIKKPDGDGSGSGAGDPQAGAPEMPSADRIYTVQVMWDETMADTAASWLRANPDGRLVILAGHGHCHDSAIVNRIKRRGITDVVSTRTIVDDGSGRVAAALVKPANDFLVVLDLPEDVKAQMKAAADSDE